jgi:branched-chain amino acid aminotransferase
MAVVVNVNGRIGGEQEAMISVLDHGFLYGEGVYEVVCAYNRKPFLFDRHVKRMRTSAEMIALSVPYSDAELEARVTDTIAAFHARPQNAQVANAYVRLLLTRGVGDITYDPASCQQPSLVIIVKALGAFSGTLYDRGVKVAIVSVVRNHPRSINPLIKSNNLLNNALAFQEALRHGAFEGVMRNYRGELAECSTSNLFLVKDGTALTPPLDTGLLSGITRGFVFEICDAIGVPVKQRVLHDEDLFGADESFLTSTTKEVVPIVQVDDRTIGDGRPGPWTKRLLEAYRTRVKEMTEG